MIARFLEAARAGNLAWDRFWFEADYSRQMRCFRLLFCLLLSYFYLTRVPDLGLYYTDSGIVPIASFQEIMATPFRYSLFQYFTSDLAVYVGHAVFLAALLLLALGLVPRLVAPVVLALHLSFMHRNMAIVFGVDLIASFFFLYFCFADFRKRAPGSAPDFRSILGSMVYRLCQIQVCVIYCYSGFEKLRGSYWWRGEAIWTVLANSQLSRWDFSFLSHFPLVVVLATYSTVLWEVYFPVLVWVKKVRPIFLLFGAMLHIGIAITMNIAVFGLMMILTYILFLDGEIIEECLGRLKMIFKIS